MKKDQVEFFIPKNTTIHVDGIPVKLTKKALGKTHKNNLSLISFTGFKPEVYGTEKVSEDDNKS